jgi:putative FmdB family regulatory protein
MPVYSFRCSTCGYEFDDLAPMDSLPERPCERPIGSTKPCEGTARRVPSLPAPAKFLCPMPTAKTRHHKHGEPQG